MRSLSWTTPQSERQTSTRASRRPAVDLGWHNNLPVIIVPGFGSSTLHVVTSKVRHLPKGFSVIARELYSAGHTLYSVTRTPPPQVSPALEKQRVWINVRMLMANRLVRHLRLDPCHFWPACWVPAAATRRVLAPALLHARSEYKRVLEYLSRYGIR